ncbi:MAG: two component transcriptional regulator, LuxR family [Solirubrobacterales bacterium]|nr:two component transcriptional regulator, LuxR family [Solirubrobacterales bacterium]
MPIHALPSAAPTRSPAAIRVVIGDRHPLFRDAIARAVRADPTLELLTQSESPWTALRDVARLRPEVAVLDPSYPGRDDDELLDSLVSHGSTRIVLLTARVDGALAFHAVARGVAAVLSKSLDGAQVCRAITAVVRGETVLAREAQGDIAAELRARRVDGRARLTERERQVLAGVAAGRSAPDIAGDLHLGTATVKTHLLRLYEKLGVSERAAAVAQAMRDGLLE